MRGAFLIPQRPGDGYAREGKKQIKAINLLKT
jgi:hypothetical protein